MSDLGVHLMRLQPPIAPAERLALESVKARYRGPSLPDEALSAILEELERSPFVTRECDGRWYEFHRTAFAPVSLVAVRNDSLAPRPREGER